MRERRIARAHAEAAFRHGVVQRILRSRVPVGARLLYMKGDGMVDGKRDEVELRDEETLDPCVRAENEDDDGYDPYSDRRPDPEPLFERDPWA